MSMKQQMKRFLLLDACSKYIYPPSIHYLLIFAHEWINNLLLLFTFLCVCERDFPFFDLWNGWAQHILMYSIFFGTIKCQVFRFSSNWRFSFCWFVKQTHREMRERKSDEKRIDCRLEGNNFELRSRILSNEWIVRFFQVFFFFYCQLRLFARVVTSNCNVHTVGSTYHVDGINWNCLPLNKQIKKK